MFHLKWLFDGLKSSLAFFPHSLTISHTCLYFASACAHNALNGCHTYTESNPRWHFHDHLKWKILDAFWCLFFFFWWAFPIIQADIFGIFGNHGNLSWTQNKVLWVLTVFVCATWVWNDETTKRSIGLRRWRTPPWGKASQFYLHSTWAHCFTLKCTQQQVRWEYNKRTHKNIQHWQPPTLQKTFTNYTTMPQDWRNKEEYCTIYIQLLLNQFFCRTQASKDSFLFFISLYPYLVVQPIREHPLVIHPLKI